MPGNLRGKLRKTGPTEHDYIRARKQAIYHAGICAECCEAIDTKLKPVCVKVNTSGFTVENARDIPLVCGPDCKHPKKANPWSASADHIIPVSKLPPGSPLLASRKNLRIVHNVCNQRKGAGNVASARFVSSGDWF